VTPLDIRIEQAHARGLLPEEIALRLHVPLRRVLSVGEAMDAARHHVDDPMRDVSAMRCPQGHYLTDDNLVRRSDGRSECLTCKRDRSREFGRAVRARKKAS
jgi:hypothetical protein